MRPPFAGLPSQRVMSNVLSYYGYFDEVIELMYLLSKSTTRYYKLEMFALKRQIRSWEPFITEVIFFGDEKFKADCIYPRED